MPNKILYSKLSKYKTGTNSNRQQSDFGSSRPKSCFSGRTKSITTASQRLRDPMNMVPKELINDLE